MPVGGSCLPATQRQGWHGVRVARARVSGACALDGLADSCALAFVPAEMFSANNKQQTQSLWMWRMEYLHHEQRPLYFGEWF